MFRIEDVTKVYTRGRSQVLAFSAASLQVAEGEYVAIIGPSGSGKTTLLSILGGMLSPSSGRVWLGDTSLYDVSVKQRARLRRKWLGFVFQTFNLLPYLTALENVQIPLYLSGMSRSKQLARANSLLERVGLSDRRDHKPHELSIGQQQRVALARTVANDPPVILADEPTGNLDPESRQRVLDFLDELHQQQRTIVTVTHDGTAAARAQRKLALHNGVVTTAPSAPIAGAA